jgi:replicative DNA helicase
VTAEEKTTEDLGPERAVLGSVLLQSVKFAEVRAALGAGDFYLPAHRDVFEAMDALAARAVRIDVITLGDELLLRKAMPRLEGGEAYLLELAKEVPSAENLGHYLDIVARRSAVREFKAVCRDLQAHAEGDPEGAQVELLRAQRLLTQVQKGRRKPGVDLADLVTPVIDELEARRVARESGGSKLVGLSTGITNLDYLTGGLRKGTLNIIAARTSLGKTAYASQMLLLAAVFRQIPGLFFSLEMTPLELAERFFSRLSGVDSARMRNGELNAAEFQRIFEAGGRMERRGLLTITNTRTLGAIAAEARAFRVAHPDQEIAIAVDYLQIVRTGERGRSREQEVAEVSGTLKDLSIELECPFVVPAQLNRGPESEERDPRVSDIRDSGAIEQDADLILFVVRKREEAKGLATVVVGKNRHGAVGEVDARWQGATYELRDPDGPPPTRGWQDTERDGDGGDA